MLRRLRTVLLIPILAAALGGVAGCGSGSAEVEEVPGPPAELSIPRESGSQDPLAEGTATPTPTTTPDGEGTPAPDTSGSTGGTGSAATPAPAEDGPASDTAPAAGSAPDKFEEFCQQNAGAC